MTWPRVCIILAALLLALPAGADLPRFGLATPNRALLRSQPEQFYQYVDRNFEGQASRPWSGGQFGWVRNPGRWQGALMFSRFHEGLDIRPVQRDAEGIPRDPVASIAPGRVVHVQAVTGRSSYGRYVVVEHATDDGPLYSLYAHLQSVAVKPGQTVAMGDTLGILGWSGPGLNLRRAHLHLELGILLHSQFPRWHDRFASGTNHNGVHNGINLVGLDLAWIYQQQARGRSVDLKACLDHFDPAWKVVVPRPRNCELPRRHRVYADGGLARADAWAITFSRHGLPLDIEPSRLRGGRAALTWVAETKLPITVLTNWKATRKDSGDEMTGKGRAHVALVTGDF